MFYFKEDMIKILKDKIKKVEYSVFEKSLDKFITKSRLTIPLFFILLFIIFEITFSVWNFFANIIDLFANYLYWLTWVDNRFINAIFWWILGILVYIPNVFILYFFLYLLQDSWLLPRVSYVFDKYLKKLGLSWEGFLSMFLWFWCTVPAILATRAVQDKKERILTIMILPFISCSAKLPVFVLLISAFIPSYLQSFSLIWIYIFWILMWILSNYFLHKVLKHDSCKLKINLPHYKIPKLKPIIRRIYDVLKDFLVKISVFILPFSIILTLLFTYPNANKIEDTYWAKIWQQIWVIFQPLWFNDKMSISVISGFVWKEVIVSTLWSLYYLEDSDSTDRLVKKMQNDTSINFASAMSFLVFILLYTACMWAVFTAKLEIWNKWAFIFFLYPIIFAWIISFIVFKFLSVLY